MKAPKHTLNRFLARQGGGDLRFYNQQSRERGIYVSRKVIHLKKEDSLRFLLQGRLKHFLALQLIGKGQSEKIIRLYLNGKLVEDKQLISEKSNNEIRLESEEDAFLKEAAISNSAFQCTK